MTLRRSPGMLLSSYLTQMWVSATYRLRTLAQPHICSMNSLRYVQWNALGPQLQELQHAAFVARGAAVFRGSGGVGMNASVSRIADGLTVGAALEEAAAAAVRRAGHLRRVLLALPQPEPLTRMANIFARSAPVSALMGASATVEDPLAPVLSRGQSSLLAAELTDKVRSRILQRVCVCIALIGAESACIQT